MCISVWSRFIHILGHLKHAHVLFRILRGICLSTFSHDAVRILASPESTARGRALCKTGELIGAIYSEELWNRTQKARGAHSHT